MYYHILFFIPYYSLKKNILIKWERTDLTEDKKSKFSYMHTMDKRLLL